MSQISIASFVVPNYHGDHGGCTAKLRIYADQVFQTSDGKQIIKSKPGGNVWYLELDCDVLDTNLTVPAFTIDSTTDSNVKDATYTGLFFDDYVHPTPQYLFKHYEIPDGLGSSIEFSDIVTYNEDPPVNNPGVTYTQEQTDAKIAAAIATVNNSASAATVFAAMRQRKYVGETGYETIAIAVTTIGTDVVELIVTAALTPVVNDLTTNCNTLLTYEGKGSTTTSSGKTFTINNLNAPGNQRRFFGAGRTILGPNAVPNSEIRLDWWASKCNTGDITAMAQQAFDSASNNANPLLSRGAIVRYGTGTWNHNEIVVPNLVTVAGAGNSIDGGAYGSADVGTTIRLVDLSANCLFRLPEGYFGQRFFGFNGSIGASTTASVLLAEGNTTSGLGMSAMFVTFQGTLGNVGGAKQTGPSLVKFHHTASNNAEFVGNEFTQCWFQVPEASMGTYCDSINTVLTFNTCQWQCGKKATARKWLSAGWMVNINRDDRGQNVYNYTKTLERTIALATITQNGSSYSATAVLDPTTPTNKQFKASDAGEPVVSGAFTATVQRFIDAFTAILSFHPTSTITAQPLAMYRWDDFADTAYAADDFEGAAINQVLTIGGADEGFNYSFITANSSQVNNLTYQNSTLQGRGRFTGATKATFTKCALGSCMFEDKTTSEDVAVVIDDCSWTIYTPFSSFLLTTQVWRTYDASTRRIAESGIQPYYTDNTGTGTYTYPYVNRHGNAISVIDPNFDVANGLPLYGLGTTDSSGNIPCLRWGRVTGTVPVEQWLYYYQLSRSNADGKCYFTGNQPGFRAYNFDDVIEAPTATIPSITVATALLATGTGTISSNSKTGSLGYSAGAGGSGITQPTSRATGFTFQGNSGIFATSSSALAPDTEAICTITNASVTTGHIVIPVIHSNYETGLYIECVETNNGFWKLLQRNVGTAPLGASTNIKFIVFKIATS